MPLLHMKTHCNYTAQKQLYKVNPYTRPLLRNCTLQSYCTKAIVQCQSRSLRSLLSLPSLRSLGNTWSVECGNAGTAGNAGNAGTAGNVGNGIDFVQLLLCNIITMYFHVQTRASVQQIRASAFCGSFAKAIRASAHNVQIAKTKKRFDYLHSPVIRLVYISIIMHCANKGIRTASTGIRTLLGAIQGH